MENENGRKSEAAAPADKRSERTFLYTLARITAVVTVRGPWRVRVIGHE